MYWTVLLSRHVTLDAPATVVNGRTIVPLRFVSENVFCDVYWNAKIRTLEIDSIAAVTKVNRFGDNTPIGASFTRIANMARRNDSA